MNNSISEMTRIWQQVLKLVDARLQERQIFDSFFADTYINDIKGDTIVVIVNSLTAERLLSSKYIDLLKEAVGEVTEFSYNLEFKQLGEVTKSKNAQLGNQNKNEEDTTFFKNAEIKSE